MQSAAETYVHRYSRSHLSVVGATWPPYELGWRKRRGRPSRTNVQGIVRRRSGNEWRVRNNANKYLTNVAGCNDGLRGPVTFIYIRLLSRNFEASWRQANADIADLDYVTRRGCARGRVVSDFANHCPP